MRRQDSREKTLGNMAYLLSNKIVINSFGNVGAFGILLFFWPRRGPPAKIGRLGDSSEREGRGT